MGILDWFRRTPESSAPNGAPIEFSPTYMFSADDVRDIVAGLDSTSPEQIYANTSDLRTVLDFRARNFSQISMHAYALQSDGGRERVRDSLVSRVLKTPAPGLTWPGLMWATCLDFDLHGETFLLFNPLVPALVHIPARRVKLTAGSWEMGDFVAEVSSADGRNSQRVDASALIPIRVYNPGGKSPLETLRDKMKEQAAAQAFRLNRWQHGLQTGEYVTRPKDAPQWTLEAQQRFSESLRRYRASGGNAGGTPVLEDGMEIRGTEFNAAESQFLEMAKLAREQYAAAYGVTPAMLGTGDGVTYANLREYRQMLYSETLGALFSAVEAALNAFLLPIAEPGRDDLYLEFNLKERLKSDPADQARIYQASVGAPIMTRNEARARENLPAVEGGDELITPLNVVTGGLASPVDTDGTEGQLSGQLEVKAAPKFDKITYQQEHVDEVAGVFERFFTRQKKSVLSSLGAVQTVGEKSALSDLAEGLDIDFDRWREELADDLLEVTPDMLKARTLEVAERFDIPQDLVDDFLDDLMAGDIRRFAKRVQDSALSKVLESDDPAHIFDVLIGTRAGQYADTLISQLMHSRTVDMVKAHGEETGEQMYKTWVTTSSDPRSEHAAMNGQKVPVDQKFSNGADFPRDYLALGGPGVANCQCEVIISVE